MYVKNKEKKYTLSGIPFILIAAIPWIVGVITIIQRILNG